MVCVPSYVVTGDSKGALYMRASRPWKSKANSLQILNQAKKGRSLNTTQGSKLGTPFWSNSILHPWDVSHFVLSAF